MSYILITGCDGFIGSKVTKALLEEGNKVLGISTNKEANVVHENFKFISINITDCLSIEKVFKENDISSVIHLAAIAHTKKGQKIDWNTYYRVNTLASKTIFECAAKVKASVFFASTVDVYGACEDGILTEDSIPVPVSDYGISKYKTEIKLSEIAEYNKLDYVIARFAPVYSQEHMNDVYKRIYLKNPIIAFKIGNGLKYQFLHLKKVIDFICEWNKNKAKNIGVVNLFDNELVDTKDLLCAERNNSKAKIVLIIPEPMVSVIKRLLDLILKLNKSSKILALHTTVYKLIRPPRYGNGNTSKQSSSK